MRLFSPIVHLPGPVVAFCVKFRGKLNYCIKIRGCGIYKTVSLHPRCWLVPPLQVGACFGPFSRLFFLCALCPICQSTSPLLQVLGDSEKLSCPEDSCMETWLPHRRFSGSLSFLPFLLLSRVTSSVPTHLRSGRGWLIV